MFTPVNYAFTLLLQTELRSPHTTVHKVNTLARLQKLWQLQAQFLILNPSYKQPDAIMFVRFSLNHICVLPDFKLHPKRKTLWRLRPSRKLLVEFPDRVRGRRIITGIIQALGFGNEIYTNKNYVNNLFVLFSGTTAKHGPRPPHSLRFLDHKQWHTTVGRTPLDKGSAHRRDFYVTTLTTDIHAPGRNRTCNPSKRSAVDTRLRPLGHWDRQLNNSDVISKRMKYNELLLTFTPNVRLLYADEFTAQIFD